MLQRAGLESIDSGTVRLCDEDASGRTYRELSGEILQADGIARRAGEAVQHCFAIAAEGASERSCVTRGCGCVLCGREAAANQDDEQKGEREGISHPTYDAGQNARAAIPETYGAAGAKSIGRP